MRNPWGGSPKGSALDELLVQFAVDAQTLNRLPRIIACATLSASTHAWAASGNPPTLSRFCLQRRRSGTNKRRHPASDIPKLMNSCALLIPLIIPQGCDIESRRDQWFG